MDNSFVEVGSVPLWGFISQTQNSKEKYKLLQSQGKGFRLAQSQESEATGGAGKTRVLGVGQGALAFLLPGWILLPVPHCRGSLWIHCTNSSLPPH